jgi:PKD repeat protein
MVPGVHSALSYRARHVPEFLSASGTNQSLFNINASTGVLTFASAAVIGTYSVSRTATNSAGNDAQNLTIDVIAASEKTNYFQAKFF